MKRVIVRCLLCVLSVAAVAGAGALAREKAEPKLAHMVYFTLKDHSKEARDKFVASCHKHLTGHEGAVYFSVGTIAEDVKEPVSDREFDVSLNVVFKNKQANATYQAHPRHKKFIEENKDSWAKVRVFDSYLTEE